MDPIWHAFGNDPGVVRGDKATSGDTAYVLVFSGGLAFEWPPLGSQFKQQSRMEGALAPLSPSPSVRIRNWS